MLRLIVLTLLAVAHPALAADSVTFLFGEWVNTGGGAVTFVHESKYCAWQPFLFFDGSRVDFTLFGRYPLPSGQLMVGTEVGSSQQNAAVGSTGYGALHARAGLTVRGLSFVSRFTARHSRERRLAHYAVIGLSYAKNGRAAAVLYEPIRKQSPDWDHRLALRLTAPYRTFRLTVEGRRSLEGTKRNSLHVEVTIPLK